MCLLIDKFYWIIIILRPPTTSKTTTTINAINEIKIYQFMESLGRRAYTHGYTCGRYKTRKIYRERLYIYNNDIKRIIFTKFMQEIYAAVQQITVIYR